MFRRKIVVRIAEQSLGCGNQFRIVVARAQGKAGIGSRGHGVNVGIVGKTRMRVVIEGRDFFNLRKQAPVDLLNIGAGERTGLGGGEETRSRLTAQAERKPR